MRKPQSLGRRPASAVRPPRPLIIPAFWWRHNEHVEALVALRDHHHASFGDTAPATAPVDWFRALRDITVLLRS